MLTAVCCFAESSKGSEHEPRQLQADQADVGCPLSRCIFRAKLFAFPMQGLEAPQLGLTPGQLKSWSESRWKGLSWFVYGDTSKGGVYGYHLFLYGDCNV